MNAELQINLAAAAAVVGLTAYVLLAGADFGGGVWDLFATGRRRSDQREAIMHAMGPVWEANHVWLIFVLVVLFTCFPIGYAWLAKSLFLPFHLALLGIMLRGGAFVFRSYSKPSAGTAGAWSLHNPMIWQRVFGITSLIAPFLLGSAFGAVTAGSMHSGPYAEQASTIPAWLRPYSISCGLLALSTCAYLAAVYLCVETDGELREDFRRRSIIAGSATAGLAGLTLLLAYEEAHWFFARLFSGSALGVVAAGLVTFAASAFAVFSRRYHLARLCAAAEIVLLVAGWALAQRPYLAYPEFTLASAAAPLPTIQFMLLSLPFGLLLIGPSFWLLIRTFKFRSACSAESRTRSS